MPGNRANGTFTAATTVSETVKGSNAEYKLAAASGTWSVSLQAQNSNGEWVNVGSAVTAAAEASVERAAEQSWRLNCTALTNTLKNITGITNANPAVVTSASHGFSNGNVVVIAGVPGMDQVNGKTFTVANQATNSFELSGTDSTNYGVYGSPKNVTGITKANPAVVTAPGHGLANGESVRLANVVGMTQVNNNTYTVAGATANTFQLSATDSSAYGVYGSPGNITDLTTTGTTVKAITGISKANPGAVTCVGHGFTTGDKIRIVGVKGMSEVNGNEYTVTYVGADSFTIGVNSTGYGTYTEGGHAIRGPRVSMTVASHGYSAGDTVRVEGVIGPTDLNDRTFTVAVADSNTLTIQNVDMTHGAQFGGPTAPAITGITKANPAVVTTAAAHGFSNGDVVKFAGVVGMTDLNGNTYTVANKADTTFQLSATNSTGYGTYGSPATITAITKANPGVITATAHGFSEGHVVWFASIGGMTELNGTAARVKRITTGTAKAITGISKANPGSVTCVGHGFSNGDVVRLSGIGGMTELNGVDVTVTSTGTDTFTIGINTTTGYTTYTSGGSAIKLNADTFALTSSADASNIDTSGFTTYTSGGTATRRGGTVRRNQSGTVTKIAGTASKVAGTASINAIRYELTATTDASKRSVVL